MTALELYQRQCKYDSLHHIRMVRILTGTTDPQNKRVLDLHKRAIERPAEGYNVVDLDNLEYIKILDKEECRQRAPFDVTQPVLSVIEGDAAAGAEGEGGRIIMEGLK